MSQLIKGGTENIQVFSQTLRLPERGPAFGEEKYVDAFPHFYHVLEYGFTFILLSPLMEVYKVKTNIYCVLIMCDTLWLTTTEGLMELPPQNVLLQTSD